MKKLIIIILLSIFFYAVNAQKQPVDKPKYQQAVILAIADYQNLIISLNEWQRLCIHDPNTTAEEKVKLAQNLQSYALTLSKKYKADSILVSVDTTMVTKPKKK